jgi:hypothetical protein
MPMSTPHISIAAQSYAGSESYLSALADLLSPRFSDWSIGIEADIPPFSTFERLLQACECCESLGVGFYLDDTCMMADYVDFERVWLTPPQLDALAGQCSHSFLGVRLHTISQTHEVTPNHYTELLTWSASNQREIQLVVDAPTWPGCDWQRTASVWPKQPWTVLANVHPGSDQLEVCRERVRRLPPGGRFGYSFHLDHPEPCNAAVLDEYLSACLQNGPACLVLRPLGWVVDNPGSAKLPDDLHSWPLFNMVDALRPKGRLVLTECGELIAATLA